MFFENPYSDFCYYIDEKISDSRQFLHQQEIELADKISSLKRRNHFLSGRRCAQQLISPFLKETAPILKNKDRSPQWPDGIKGSITHDNDLAAALILHPDSPFKGVGIDIEDLTRKLSPAVSKHILTDWELSQWNKNKEGISQETRIIFSIKEAIFKCFHPLNKIYLGFHDAIVTRLDKNSFEADILKFSSEDKEESPLHVEGKFLIAGSKVMAAVIF